MKLINNIGKDIENINEVELMEEIDKLPSDSPNFQVTYFQILEVQDKEYRCIQWVNNGDKGIHLD